MMLIPNENFLKYFGDIELVEYGHPKDDKGLPVFNYSIAYEK